MNKNGRIHIRVKEELADKVRCLAKRRHTTVTALIEQFFLELVEQEENQSVEPAEQI